MEIQSIQESDITIVIEQNFLSEAINEKCGKVVEVYTKIKSNNEVVLEEKQSTERYITSDLKKAIDYLTSGQNSPQTSSNISCNACKC
ncbi:hypothetical protein HMPREF9700_01829 [Bergeyella zoohelcum CCUG 30536]|uniref:Uncharacterized protein n=1 Tax=Bergeyella zoohelcum TaxID=1015 RepID=A0A380ZUY2_9FLAO|nr:hypothetical protein HMPREF9700_01829 [Bergeyella zoohelcum CCUG 30536]SUV53162.1 Uncharacterised protein [Bergeyella zoohelcum]